MSRKNMNRPNRVEKTTLLDGNFLGYERQEVRCNAAITREKAVHAAFATSRIEDFVYAKTLDQMKLLDEYCNPDNLSEKRAPFVVYGPPGSGKTALLCNWTHEKRLQDPDEQSAFIFCHYTGCSFDSVKLGLFLYRFIHRLKETFGLKDFELPKEDEEEKLRFSLGRCLEAAMSSRSRRQTENMSVKQHNIILIVDAVEHLRTEVGTESLTWLPNHLPTGVRVILSTTVAPHVYPPLACKQVVRGTLLDDSENEMMIFTKAPEPRETDRPSIRDLRRRGCSFLFIQPLDNDLCLMILEKYRIKQGRADFISKVDVEKILNHPGSSSPLYIRLLLECVFHPLNKYDSNRWLNEVLLASNVEEIFEINLRLWNEILVAEWTTTTTTAFNKEDNGFNKKDNTFTAMKGNISNNNKEENAPKRLAKSRSLRDSTTTFQPKVEQNKETLGLLLRHVLSLFAVSRYGLSERELHALLSDTVPKDVQQILLTILHPILMTIQREDSNQKLFNLSHDYIRTYVRCNYLDNEQLRHNYHKELALYFGSMDAGQRKVEELPIHLEYCSMWGKLEASLVDIHMFQIWWTEENVENFLSFWQVCRLYVGGHDPVEQYIRSLDEYIHTENVSLDMLLKLILKVTEFLRCWQDLHSQRLNPELRRPSPPEMKELMSYQNITHEDDSNLHTNIEILSCQPNDSYYLKRWLWTQFPLIALAFEKHFVPSNVVFEENHNLSTLETKLSRSKKLLLPTKNLIEKSPTLSRGVNTACFPMKELSLTSFTARPTLDFLSGEKGGDVAMNMEKLLEQVSSLRLQYDKVYFIAMKKEKELQHLQEKAAHYLCESNQRCHDVQKQLDLEFRMKDIKRLTLESKEKSLYYKVILKLCECHPAKDSKAVEIAENEIQCLKKEYGKLTQATQESIYACKLSTFEIPKLSNAIECQRKTHEKVLMRLNYRQAEINRQKAWEHNFYVKKERNQSTNDLNVFQEKSMIEKLNFQKIKWTSSNEEKRQLKEQLKLFDGCTYADDGMLGKLRKVGIQSSEDIMERLFYQMEHEKELKEESLLKENQLISLRDKLNHYREEQISLKYGTNHVKENESNHEGSKNIKQLENLISEKTRIMQQSFEKADRMEKLVESVRQGLQHIGEMMEAADTCTILDSVHLVQAIDKKLQKLIGEDSHLISMHHAPSSLSTPVLTFSPEKQQPTWNTGLWNATNSYEKNSPTQMIYTSPQNRTKFNLRIKTEEFQKDDDILMKDEEDELFVIERETLKKKKNSSNIKHVPSNKNSIQ